MGGYSSSCLDAGVFYCPYIELQYFTPPTKKVQRKWRKEYLMRCPSAPYSCTGECNTPEYARRVEDILDKEFA